MSYIRYAFIPYNHTQDQKPCLALFSLQMLPKLLWPTSCAWLQASGTLTETSAKQLLLQWQAVKANALGNYALSGGFTLKITF